jgi:hypothetical protein
MLKVDLNNRNIRQFFKTGQFKRDRKFEGRRKVPVALIVRCYFHVPRVYRYGNIPITKLIKSAVQRVQSEQKGPEDLIKVVAGDFQGKDSRMRCIRLHRKEQRSCSRGGGVQKRAAPCLVFDTQQCTRVY